MKNILFLVLCFLFLPFASYSQTALFSFEDSVLTVVVKPSNLQSETDTIYPSGVPNKINFVFEDVDSIEKPFEVTIAILDKIMRPLRINKYSTNGKVSFPISNVKWEERSLMVFTKFKKNSILDSSEYIIDIIPKPILEKIEREEKERIQDSTNRTESLIKLRKNHPLAVEYYQNRFDKLKQPQENLTEKEEDNIWNLSGTIPPNCRYVNEKISIDETEISVINWLEYLLCLHNDSSKQHYELAFPDTTVWRSLYNISDFDELYLNYPVYRYYPVVGITHEQAQRFCIWRGNMVSHYLNEDQKNKYKTYETTVHFRLPSKEEWEYVAIKDDLNKQFGGYSTKRRYTEKEKRKVYRSAEKYSDSTRTIEQVRLDMKNYFESDTSYKRMFNYKPTYQNPYFDKNLLLFDERLITNWVYLYKPTNQFKLYNMFGNVAEMTSEKGIAKGGSFAHTLEECTADRVQTYDSPQAWLGFRCVAEVVVRKKE